MFYPNMGPMWGPYMPWMPPQNNTGANGNNDYVKFLKRELRRTKKETEDKEKKKKEDEGKKKELPKFGLFTVAAMLMVFGPFTTMLHMKLVKVLSLQIIDALHVLAQ